MADRNEFINGVKAQLDEWNRDIDRLQAKFDEASDDVKESLRPALHKAHEARDAVARKLDQVENTTDDAWDSVKDDAHHAWDSFKNAVNHFKSHF